MFMSKDLLIPSRCVARLTILTITVVCAFTLVSAQASLSGSGKKIYEQIKQFPLNGGSVATQGLVLKRDRAEMTFTGTFYFTGSVEGRVTGAVFVGQGQFRAEVPPSEFEKANLRRLLGTAEVESNFKTAVLRFSDDTFEVIGKGLDRKSVV